MRLTAFLLTSVALISVTGAACRRGASREEPAPGNNPGNANNANTTSAAGSSLDKNGAADASATFKKVILTGAKHLEQLKAQLGPGGTTLMLKINRVDLKHIRTNETLLVADGAQSLLSCSPFPVSADSARAFPKLIIVSRAIQAFGAYEAGKLVLWGPTSTGKKATPTPEGLFFANWKAKRTTSTVNDEWVLNWCVNLDSAEGVSMHEYELPGYPASHSCVRLMEEDARWIYNWVDQWIVSKDGGKVLARGTPVIIFGDYAYKKTPPWKLLTEEPSAGIISPSALEAITRRHESTINESRRERELLLQQQLVK